MTKKKIKNFTYITVLLIMIIRLLNPDFVFANDSFDFNENEVSLFTFNRDIHLENGISFVKGSEMYGEKNNDIIKIQIANDYINVSIGDINIEEYNDGSPIYYETLNYLNLELINYPKETKFYSDADMEKLAFVLSEDLILPSYHNLEDDKRIVIGNTEFYVKDENDLSISENETESDKDQNGNFTSEAPSTEESENIKLEDGKQNSIETDNIQSQKSNSQIDSENIVSLFGNESLMVSSWDDLNLKYYKPNHDLYVYNSPHGNIRTVIGILKENQVYRRISDYGNWHQIQFGNGYGYVYKDYTSVANQLEMTQDANYYNPQARTFTTLNSVQVYDSPHGSSRVSLGELNQGITYPIEADFGNWWRIVYSNKVGYVYKDYVEADFLHDDKFFKANANIHVYDSPDSAIRKKIGELTSGTAYHRLNDYGNWHQIQFGNSVGYVYKPYTSFASQEEASNIINFNNSQARTFTGLSSVKVYNSPDGTSRNIIGEINMNIKYPIEADYGNWWRIVFSNSIGYVYKDYVAADFFESDKYFKTNENIYVYDSPDANSRIKIGELINNQAYARLNDYGNWHQIQFGKEYGYVYKPYTSFANQSDVKNLNISHRNLSRYFEADISLDVYNTPNAENRETMGVISEGTIYSIEADYGNWWRIIFSGRIGYVYKDYTSLYGRDFTNYTITLEEALNIQLKANAQTDKNYGYVSKDYIVNNIVTTDVLNVRSGAGTSKSIIGQLSKGNPVRILDEYNGWYIIEFIPNQQWIDAMPKDILYYLNPKNFENDDRQVFQFLDLSKTSNTSANELNKFLAGKGTLSGMGQAFIDAGKLYNVNEIYLISHALLETGHGTSILATGVNYNGRTVYNMFGINAADRDPINLGAKWAYENNWFTPYDAIVGGAAFIGNDYIKSGLNTLYKMRWNPSAMVLQGNYGRQYATDVGWAAKQVYTMYNLYQQINYETLFLDIPVFR